MCGGGEKSHSGILASNQHNADIKADPCANCGGVSIGRAPESSPVVT